MNANRNLFLMVVWIVLMMFWLFYGAYTYYDSLHPFTVSLAIVPWACVGILGYYIFNGNAPTRV